MAASWRVGDGYPPRLTVGVSVGVLEIEISYAVVDRKIAWTRVADG